MEWAQPSKLNSLRVADRLSAEQNVGVLVFQLAQTWSAGILSTGGGAAVQEDVLNYYQDHGTITQITSPVP